MVVGDLSNETFCSRSDLEHQFQWIGAVRCQTRISSILLIFDTRSIERNRVPTPEFSIFVHFTRETRPFVRVILDHTIVGNCVSRAPSLRFVTEIMLTAANPSTEQTLFAQPVRDTFQNLRLREYRSRRRRERKRRGRINGVKGGREAPSKIELPPGQRTGRYLIDLIRP